MLDNYEEPLDISLIENNSFLQENHMNTATGNWNKGSHLTESTQNLPPTTNANALSDLKQTQMKEKVRLIYRNWRVLKVNGIIS